MNVQEENWESRLASLDSDSNLCQLLEKQNEDINSREKAIVRLNEGLQHLDVELNGKLVKTSEEWETKFLKLKENEKHRNIRVRMNLCKLGE